MEMMMALIEAFQERCQNLRTDVPPRFPFSVLYRTQNQELRHFIMRPFACHEEHGRRCQ